MSDRELLELAAKAAGVPNRVVGAEPGYYALHPDVDGVERFCCMYQWNPLTDDGDALRLAVKLKLNVDLAYEEECVVRVFNDTHFFKESTAQDHFAATRRAIVRAAAEIGKAMP